jgi:hypothetical protein
VDPVGKYAVWNSSLVFYEVSFAAIRKPPLGCRVTQGGLSATSQLQELPTFVAGKNLSAGN